MKYVGKWQGSVDTSVFKGDVTVDIFDNNGEYGFSVTVPGLEKLPKFSVYDIVEGENSLSGKAKIDILGGIVAEINTVFSGDRFTGEIRIPIFGRVPVLNGRRIG